MANYFHLDDSVNIFGGTHDIDVTFGYRDFDADDSRPDQQDLEWIGEGFFNNRGQIREVRTDDATYVEVNLDRNYETPEMIIMINEAVDLNGADFLL